MFAGEHQGDRISFPHPIARSVLMAFNQLIKNNFSREDAKAQRTTKNIEKGSLKNSAGIVYQKEIPVLFVFVLYFFASSRLRVRFSLFGVTPTKNMFPEVVEMN